jgi:hypothetical protein
MRVEVLCTVQDSSSSWSSSLVAAWGMVALSASCGWGKGKVAAQDAYKGAWDKEVGTCEKACEVACETACEAAWEAWGRGILVAEDNNVGVLAGDTSLEAPEEVKSRQAGPLFLLFS